MEELEQLCNQYKDMTQCMLSNLLTKIKIKEAQCKVLEEKIELLQKQLKQVESERNNSSSHFIKVEKLIEGIREQIEQNDWRKVKSSLKYLIKYHEYYKQFILTEYIGMLLHLTTLYGYDRHFVERFIEGNTNWEQQVKQDKVYQMFKQEKEMPLYEIVGGCINRDFEKLKQSVHYLPGVDKEKVLRVLRNKAIKYCKEVHIIYNQSKNTISHNPIYKKIKIFVEVQGGGEAVLIEAWQKSNTKEICMTLEEFAYILREIHPEHIETVHPEYMDYDYYFDILDEEERNQSNTSIEQYFNQPTSRVEETEKKNNLSEQSPLKSMGYDTGKSRVERGYILQNVAIPQLGREKVRGYLEFFIRLNRSKENMMGTIKEWEYDLERLHDII